MRKHASIISLATVTAALAVPATSGAATFCVGTSSCAGGTPEPSLEAALYFAGANQQENTVKLGSGTFAPKSGDAFAYGGSKSGPVHIQGAGAGRTVLADPATGNAVLLVDPGKTGSTISDLGIRAPDVDNRYALRTSQVTSSRIAITQSPGTALAEGVSLDDGSILEDSSVDVRGTAVTMQAGHTVVRRSRLNGGLGFQSDGGSADLDRVRIDGLSSGVESESTDGPVHVTASTIRVTNPTNAGSGLNAVGGGRVDAERITMIGGSQGTALESYSATPAETSTLNVTDSIVVGFGRTLRRQSSGGGGANLNVTYSDYQPSAANDIDSGIGSFDYSTGDVNVPAVGFVSASDLHLRHDSPLIDRGRPGPAPTGTDFDGLPPAVDGNGDGIARRDMGAFEYQRRAPVLTLSGPAEGSAGRKLTFRANATDLDPGDAVAVKWAFDDHATAAGNVVTHVWHTAGQHTVTVTATDSAGRKTSRTKHVRVAVIVTNLHAAPTAFRSRGRHAGTKLRFTLSGAARVRITATRHGRNVGRTVAVRGRQGVNRVGFGRGLPAGSYRLVVRPSIGAARRVGVIVTR